MTSYNHFVRTLIPAEKFFVLDTETTGLHDGEICQIAIIDNVGEIHVNTLINTKFPIPTEATAIHGITNKMVENAPFWSDIATQVQELLHGQIVVIYNAVYDRKMLHQTAEKAGLDKYDWKNHSEFLCCMEAFAELYGDWNDYHKSYRWQTLTTAANYFDIENHHSHDALGDCRATLHVTLKMLQKYAIDKALNANGE